MPLNDTHYVFDGFAHRRYDPERDDWMNHLPNPANYACVMQAQSVLALFAELQMVQKENWKLLKENERLRKLLP